MEEIFSEFLKYSAMIFEEISRGIPSREPEWKARRADAAEYATHPRIL